MAHILLAEPDALLAEYLSRHLQSGGHSTEIMTTGQDVQRRVLRSGTTAVSIDLVSLTLQLPDMHGFQVLREMRASLDLPVILLSECGEEAHRVRGFWFGADDFLSKPFGVNEYVARIDALLRRAMRAPNGQPVVAAPAHRAEMTGPSAEGHETRISFGPIVVDPAARSVQRDGIDIALVPKEFDLLLALIKRAGAVATRAYLLSAVWGYENSVTSRTVDSHFASLRRKLEPKPRNPQFLLTVFKSGYRLRI